MVVEGVMVEGAMEEGVTEVDMEEEVTEEADIWEEVAMGEVEAMGEAADTEEVTDMGEAMGVATEEAIEACTAAAAAGAGAPGFPPSTTSSKWAPPRRANATWRRTALSAIRVVRGGSASLSNSTRHPVGCWTIAAGNPQQF